MKISKIHIFCLITVGLIFAHHTCIADEIAELAQFTKEDKVLILAPHPDDESIGTAGIIQRALKAGSKVKVVCFTNGDNNEFAFIVYEKRLTIKKSEFLHMGEVRSKETIAAMNSLGLNKDNIIFLGYPDHGTFAILTKYWGATKPFRSMLTRVTKVSYPEALSVNAPYVGESILNDLESILLDFKPTKIFVSHPVDTNKDHRSLYLFLHIALWDLTGQIKQPRVFPYIIHIAGWPKPRGFHPELSLQPYKKINDGSWLTFSLTEEEINAKHDAITCYQSQIKYNPPYLFSFARNNELFSDYKTCKLKKQGPKKEIFWQAVSAKDDSALSYAQSDNKLCIKLKLKRKIDELLEVSFYLLGYNKKVKFSEMPKVYLNLDVLDLHIKDKKQTIHAKDIQWHYENLMLTIKIPLVILGDPNYILSCAMARNGDLSFDESAWRIIELE